MSEALPDPSEAETARLRARVAELEGRLARMPGLLRQLKFESLGVLAAGAAHAYNNLLTGVLGYGDLAAAEPLTVAARYYLHESMASARRAAELTQQVLTCAGKAPVAPAPVLVGELVKAMGPALRPVAGLKATLTFDCPTPEPSVEADADQLRQVVAQLTANAGEALVGGEGTIALRTRVCQLGHPGEGGELPSGRYVCLEVADTGSGMSEETLAKAFDPFFTTRFPGRGLGLAAVYGIVHAHRGLVRASSTPGRGSTFEVLLPVRGS
jgi:signal transduction histidine kinase